ncbi:MAG TPA: C4-type zinc ribbon domain-containing protein [Acidimicrobiales bacterium]|nr:C4-type zinc ribbon domain-containing protein [Acidimicrobiales bacterium]
MSDAAQEGPSPADDNPFAVLLAVQDLDTSIAQHEHRKAALPERRQLDALNSSAAVLRRRAAELDGQRDEFVTRLSHLEEQTAAVVARRKALEDRLYGARGAAGRDLRAIESEVAQLAGRLHQLEDQELVVLEDQEPIDHELGRVSAELAELAEEAGGLRARVAESDRAIDAELAELAEARRSEAARLPDGLARRYENLRSRLGGIGAARLVGDRCDGCHLTLPSVEIDRIKHLAPDAVVTCDQCGRILVRPALAGGR